MIDVESLTQEEIENAPFAPEYGDGLTTNEAAEALGVLHGQLRNELVSMKEVATEIAEKGYSFTVGGVFGTCRSLLGLMGLMASTVFEATGIQVTPTAVEREAEGEFSIMKYADGNRIRTLRRYAIHMQWIFVHGDITACMAIGAHEAPAAVKEVSSAVVQHARDEALRQLEHVEKILQDLEPQ